MFGIKRDGENADFVKPGDEKFSKGGILDPESDADGSDRIRVSLIRRHNVTTLIRNTRQKYINRSVLAYAVFYATTLIVPG